MAKRIYYFLLIRSRLALGTITGLLFGYIAYELIVENGRIRGNVVTYSMGGCKFECTHVKFEVLMLEDYINFQTNLLILRHYNAMFEQRRKRPISNVASGANQLKF
ncbi:hypothetical protein [Virgibacillus dokdonensis]|uniref:hypothetical protein n=1 Tax=Virgibacillus dokdonensis TaxID=302167 RepID=UPI00113230CB|nr:hypothetical protein [Virgibacillus dokdonensis]